MGLDMKTRKKICAAIFKRYQKAGKKGKAKILDEFATTLNYNRDYLANLLNNWGKIRYSVSSGKPVKYIATPRLKAFTRLKEAEKQGDLRSIIKPLLQSLKPFGNSLIINAGSFWYHFYEGP